MADATYAVPTDVRLALSPEGDPADVGSAASLEDPDLQAALNSAQDEVDGKIGGRYTLPLTAPYPDILMRITRDIAAWLATLTYLRGDPLLATNPVQLRYNAAEALLTQIQNGTLSLGAISTDGPDPMPLGDSCPVLLGYGQDLPSPSSLIPRYGGGAYPVIYTG